MFTKYYLINKFLSIHKPAQFMCDLMLLKCTILLYTLPITKVVLFPVNNYRVMRWIIVFNYCWNFFHTVSNIASIWQIAHANVDSHINVNKIYPPAHYHTRKVHHHVGDAKRVESDFTRFSKVKVKFIVVQAWIKKRPDGCWAASTCESR